MAKENTYSGYLESMPEVLLDAIDSPVLVQAFIEETHLVTICSTAAEELAYVDLSPRRLATGESQLISKSIR